MINLSEYLRPHREKAPIEPVELPVERIDIQSGMLKVNIPNPSDERWKEYRKMVREVFAWVREEAKSLSDRELLERIFIKLYTMNL